MLAGWARGLLALDEAALVRIAFRDEPLRGKLTSAMKQSLYEGARAEARRAPPCCRKTAARFRWTKRPPTGAYRCGTAAAPLRRGWGCLPFFTSRPPSK